jgi:hypothetical protein
MTIQELKKTKEFEIFMRCLETAVFPKGFKCVSGGYYTGYKVQNEKYWAKFGYNSYVALEVGIKRPDEDATSEIRIGFKSNYASVSETYDYLKELYDSPLYARGKWIKECSESFESIIVRNVVPGLKLWEIEKDKA